MDIWSIDLLLLMYLGCCVAVFGGKKKTMQDYLKTAWDAIIKYKKQDSKKIQTIKFDRCRFARGAPQQLDISSVWREGGLQEERGSHTKALPKEACNVHLAMDPHIHSTKTLPGTFSQGRAGHGHCKPLSEPQRQTGGVWREIHAAAGSIGLCER